MESAQPPGGAPAMPLSTGSAYAFENKIWHGARTAHEEGVGHTGKSLSINSQCGQCAPARTPSSRRMRWACSRTQLDMQCASWVRERIDYSCVAAGPRPACQLGRGVHNQNVELYSYENSP